MKKTILAIAAALTMSLNMTAQETTTQETTTESRPEMQRPDMTEMVKRRTDETVKKYGLNEEQAAKLLELNTKYMGQMGPRRGDMRPGGMREGRGMRDGRGMRPDSMRQMRPRPEGEMKEGQERPARPEMRGDRPERRGDRQGMRGDRQGFRQNMQEYNAELQKIMTEEQYKAYQEDFEKRMSQGPRGFRRDR